MFNKTGIIVLLILMSVFNVNSQSKTETKTQDRKISLEKNLIKVRVDGLSCPFCAYGLEKKFIKNESVENLKIDFDKGLVTFSLKKGKSIDEKTIKKIVKDAGFTPKEVIFPVKKQGSNNDSQ